MSIDVTVVLNAHREGSLAHASVESARAAAEHARRSGLEVEMLVVLDRPDSETRSYFDEYVAAWKKSGGDELTKELNAWYAANK